MPVLVMVKKNGQSLHVGVYEGLIRISKDQRLFSSPKCGHPQMACLQSPLTETRPVLYLTNMFRQQLQFTVHECVCLHFIQYIEIPQLLTPNPADSCPGRGRTRPCEYFFGFWQNGERPSLLQIPTAAVCSCPIRQRLVWLS